MKHNVQLNLFLLICLINFFPQKVFPEFEFEYPAMPYFEGIGVPFFVKYREGDRCPLHVDYALFEDGTFVRGCLNDDLYIEDRESITYELAKLDSFELLKVKSMFLRARVLEDPGYNPREGPIVDGPVRHSINLILGGRHINLSSHHESFEERGYRYPWTGFGPLPFEENESDEYYEKYLRFREVWTHLDNVTEYIVLHLEDDFIARPIGFRMKGKEWPTSAEEIEESGIYVHYFDKTNGQSLSESCN